MATCRASCTRATCVGRSPATTTRPSGRRRPRLTSTRRTTTKRKKATCLATGKATLAAALLDGGNATPEMSLGETSSASSTGVIRATTARHDANHPVAEAFAARVQ
mmetsp:Transcript_28615/g.55645  ORF Transcript_28615/g.55645 Transcript_28615/m.55645 type:complete len:106 (+) Transcript_28615:722-1039(+)